MEPVVAYIGAGGIHLDNSVGAWYNYIPTPWNPAAPVDQLYKRIQHKAAVKKAAATKKAAVPAQPMDPVLAKALAAGKLVYSALRQVGVPDLAATFGMYAAYHETRAFSSPLFLQHNNATGIKFRGQKGAVKGPGPLFYAFFPNGLLDWANAYKHEITKGSNPAGAQTIEDFAARLKANHYFEDNINNYIHGMKNGRLVLRTMPAAEWAYNPDNNYNPDTGISTEKPKEDGFMAKLEAWAKEHPMQAGLALAGVVAVTAKVLR